MNSRQAKLRDFARRNLIFRAAGSVFVSLACWWFLLKDASLYLLWGVAYLPLALFLAPPGLHPIAIKHDTGDWVFNLAVNQTVRNPSTGQSENISSVEFTGEKDNVAFFASGWFAYLALSFAAGAFARGQRNQLLKGLALQTVINLLALASYIYINGYSTLVNTPGVPDSRTWFLRYWYHIAYLVVPFAGPFAVALSVHPKWREYFAAAPVLPADSRQSLVRANRGVLKLPR
jgi:hypothetical protein